MIVRRARFWALCDLLVCVLLLLSSAIASAQQAKLVIFALASLKDPPDAVNSAYQQDKGQNTAVSYAASSTLAKQIEAAAPADIFISADLDWWTIWRSGI
jgi:molybdate transport system substrate-binding protein